MIECPFCKTHVDKHLEGRCLDAWVARLLGFDVSVKDVAILNIQSRAMKEKPKHPLISYYSTDHNDCFKYVVAEMHSHWDTVAIHGSSNYGHKWWHVRNCLHDYDMPKKYQYSAMGQDEGLPLIICRAFIKWRTEDD